jgi:hypothetical protein
MRNYSRPSCQFRVAGGPCTGRISRLAVASGARSAGQQSGTASWGRRSRPTTGSGPSPCARPALGECGGHRSYEARRQGGFILGWNVRFPPVGRGHRTPPRLLNGGIRRSRPTLISASLVAAGVSEWISDREWLRMNLP